MRVLDLFSGYCKTCAGKGHYMYDENHRKICEYCCPHDKGRWLLPDGYQDAGKWCCKRGCGMTWETETGDE